MQWSKWYGPQWLVSTLRDELSGMQQSIWVDWISYATTGHVGLQPGQFKISSWEVHARSLNKPLEEVLATRDICLRRNRITAEDIPNEGIVVTLLNWRRYNPTRGRPPKDQAQAKPPPRVRSPQEKDAMTRRLANQHPDAARDALAYGFGDTVIQKDGATTPPLRTVAPAGNAPPPSAPTLADNGHPPGRTIVPATPQLADRQPEAQEVPTDRQQAATPATAETGGPGHNGKRPQPKTGYPSFEHVRRDQALLSDLAARFPGLDLNWELDKCEEWWRGSPKQLKSAKLALQNWLQKAALLRDQTAPGGPGGQTGAQTFEQKYLQGKYTQNVKH